MNKFFIVRHGQTYWNKEHRSQGHKNSNLTDDGINQAIALGERLKAIDFDYIYSSDLGRTIETTNLILKDFSKKEYKKCQSLREICLGKWEGMTIDEIKKNYKDQHAYWVKTPLKTEVEGMENLSDARNRIAKKIKTLNEKHDNKTFLIISHGMIIKLLLTELVGIEINDMYKFKQGNTALNIINGLEGNRFQIDILNDTTHTREN
ncbi:MAG: histidine phosphatase family protein [Peptostreptococcaceae bacterium]|jgi:probable phosphoglycerate mutase|nr:histidine phosphatase family protein [Peptostreptococcaceae bacterium]